VIAQGLGDVVMSLPLLRAISKWAEGRFVVRVIFESSQHVDLIREEGLNIIPVCSPYRPIWKQVINLRKVWKAGADLVIGVPGVSADKIFLLSTALRARYTTGEVFPNDRNRLSFPVMGGWTKSILKINQEIAEALGIEGPLGTPSITVTPDEISWSESVLTDSGLAQRSPLIGLHCSSIMPSKKWPPKYFADVLWGLKESAPDLAGISFGTQSERSESEQVRALAPNVNWLEGCGQWNIRQSVSMLKACDVLISGDTGLMHMAAAVGTKTVSIFGPSSTERLAPTYNGGVALHPNTPCHPCLRRKWTPCSCILTVAPEHVIAAVKSCLAQERLAILTDESCVGSTRFVS